jgi:hypothetical protein
MHRWQTQMNAIKKILRSFIVIEVPLGDRVSFQNFQCGDNA